MTSISRTRIALAAVLLVLAARPASAQITGIGGVNLGAVDMSRNSVAYDPVHQVYLVIVARPPVTARFLDKNGNQIGQDFQVALEDGFTAWASIAFGGPPQDPVFLVTYTLADLNGNPKFGRLVRYVVGGPPSISAPSFIANSTSEWVHSEKAQSVWSGTRFIVGTRVMSPGGTLPTFQVNGFDLNGVVSPGSNLGDGNDYYGSPSVACATNGVCMVDGFMAGINSGYSGGSYGRLFDSTSLAGLGGLFYLSAGMPNEDQAVIYQAHTGRFLAEWYRGGGPGLIDTRLISADGTMSALDLSRGFSPGAGCNALAYNPGTQTSLLVTKSGSEAALYVWELGDDGYPIDPNNWLLVTGWDGAVLDYEPSIGVNNVDGQWLVTAQLQAVSIGLKVQGVVKSQTILPITILTAGTMPTATQSTPYSQLLIASGSTPPYTWSKVSGTVPPGLNLSGFSLVGTPTTPGDYSFRLHVQGGDGQTADKDFTIHVNQIIQALPGPSGAHITTAASFLSSGLVSRNNLAYDPVHEVYLMIVSRPPVTGRFLNKNGVQIGPDFVIATEPGDPYAAWASIAIGGPANDPAFLVTYVIADLGQNPKYGRLVRYVPGVGPSIGGPTFITNVTSEWNHTEKGQTIWNGTKFIVGTRTLPPGNALPTFQVQTFDMNNAVSAPQVLGDGADYYGSPALACAANGTCLAVGFQAGINTGYSGGSYARLFNGTSLAPQGLLFHLAVNNPNEDQAVVYQAHTGRFLTEWMRGSSGGWIDSRLVGTDGSMSLLDLSKGFPGPGSGCNTLVYNPFTQTSLLVNKDVNATLWAMELGDTGYPLDLSNQVLITPWDGVVLDYEPSIAANPTNGQWLVSAQIIGATVLQLVQGTAAVNQAPATVQNGNFSSGMAGWNTFASPNQSDLVTSVNSGVLSFYRQPEPAGPGHQAVVLQSTGAVVAGHTAIGAQFDMGNSSSARKRITVLLHDLDFSDLQVCSFWIPANSPMRTYVMRTFTTKTWLNATLSFYAATEGFDGGYYMLDNVSIFQQQGQPTDRTDCVDPLAPGGVSQADSAEMVSNGGFDSFLLSWQLFGNISSQVASGVFQFTRPSGDPAGALLQPTGSPIPANTPLTASFDLGNSSGVRKRVTILLHDSDFSDLQVCTLWLDPGQAMSTYTMRTFTTKAWTNATVSFYMGSVDTSEWARIDNVSLHRTPAATMLGTQCMNGNTGSGAPSGGAASQTAVSTGSTAQMATAATASTSSASTGSNSTSGDSSAPGVTQLDGGQVWSMASGTSTSVISTAPIDLRQTNSAWLQFDSLGLFGNSSAEVQVSVDGTDWATIASLPAGADWLTSTLDLSAYSGRTIYVRFRLQTGGGDTSGDQWLITNVFVGSGGSTVSKTPSASPIEREVLNRRFELVVGEKRLNDRILG